MYKTSPKKESTWTHVLGVYAILRDPRCVIDVFASPS